MFHFDAEAGPWSATQKATDNSTVIQSDGRRDLPQVSRMAPRHRQIMPRSWPKWDGGSNTLQIVQYALPGIAQTRRDAVDGQVNAVPQTLVRVTRAVALQQFDLHVVQRIEIRKAVLDRTREPSNSATAQWQDVALPRRAKRQRIERGEMLVPLTSARATSGQTHGDTLRNSGESDLDRFPPHRSVIHRRDLLLRRPQEIHMICTRKAEKPIPIDT